MGGFAGDAGTEQTVTGTNPAPSAMSRSIRPFPHRHPRPSAEQQRRNERVSQHSHLVPPLARHYGRRCSEAVEDLIQVGLLGLLRAAELYDPGQTTPFSAFARPHIRGAILHHLRDRAHAIRLPRRHHELADRIRQWHRQRLHDGGEQHEQQLLLDLGLDQGRWSRFQRLQLLARPQALNEQGLEALSWVSSDSTGEDGMEALAALATLSPLQRQAIQLVVLAGVSLRQAGARMQRSPASVRRDVRRGLDELRHRLRAAGGSPDPAPAAAAGC